jgi:molecular chaperone DnaK (HSP70)
MICKLKARLNIHGVLNVESGYYVEEVEVEEPIPEPEGEKKEGDVRVPSSPIDFDGNERSSEEPAIKRRKRSTESVPARPAFASTEPELTNDSQMDVDKEKEPPKMRKVKKQQRKGDLPLSAGTASLDEATRNLQAERENAMIMEDKLVQDTENEKNNLESMIYELKDKIIDQYAEFASDDEKSRLNAKLEQIEVCLNHEIRTMNSTLTLNRTGCTRMARTPPRHSMSPRRRTSAQLPDPSSSATTTSSRRRSRKSARSGRRRLPPSRPRLSARSARLRPRRAMLLRQKKRTPR